MIHTAYFFNRIVNTHRNTRTQYRGNELTSGCYIKLTRKNLGNETIVGRIPIAFDRLKSALSSRYAIERELGSGGMATVYLAEDLKHHRKLAVKVLRPDLAAALGTPTVGIFGSTSPAWTAPRGPRVRVVGPAGVDCSPCFRKTCPFDRECLTGVETKAVIEAAREVVGGEPR